MQTIPYSEEFEKAILVGVMADPKILTKIGDKISSNDFYKKHHQEIYKVIESIGPDNLDSLTVQEKLSTEAREYFDTLVADSDQILPTLSNILYYAESIRDKSKLRSGINLGQEITALCFEPNADVDEVLAELEQRFSKFLRDRVIHDNSETTQESFELFMKTLGVLREEAGIRTGFYDIDLMLHRLEGLVILAARPSVGKTALAINVCRNVAETEPVLFFSLEQTKEQVFERMLSSEAEIPLEEIRTQAFLSDRMGQAILSAARDGLQNALSNLFVDDTANVSTSYISSVSRQKYIEYGKIGLIIVDYLHIMKLNDKPRHEALGDAVKELRALGKELNCPILLLSQLRRSDREGEKKHRRPDLSDLRESGEIEQSADVVLFLHRDSYFNEAGLAPEIDVIEVIIKKHRNGRTGIVPLVWIPKFVKFKDR